MKKIDFMLVDDLAKNNKSKSFVINDDNDYFNVSFMAKPTEKKSFFKKLKHSYNVLRGVAQPVYFFEDIQKYYPKKSLSYLDYNKKV